MPTLIGVRRLPRILLVEPDGLVRGTVVSVCRDLQLAEVIQAGSSDLAMKLLQDDSLRAGILSLSDGGSGLDLLAQMREGAFTCPCDMPVAMTAAGIDAATAGRLKELRIRRLLLKPFKIRDLVATVETLLVAATVPG